MSSLYSYQVQDSIKIDSVHNVYVNRIIITGNETTKDVVIRREMRTKEGQPLDVQVFKRDLERIYNLGLFTKVDVTPVPITKDSLNLIIDVEESFYIIPIPQGGIKEGDLKKIWAGLKVKWRNFRGMNETLGLSFGLGYEPFINASYSNPWLGSETYFLTVSAGYSQKYIQDIFGYPPGTIVDKDTVPRYSTESLSLFASVGRKLSRDLSVTFGLGYNVLSVSEFKPGRSLSPNGVDEYPSAIVGAHLDSRDLFSYPSNGALVNIDFIKYGFANQYINFNRLSSDVRKYIPIIPFKNYTIIFASRIVNSISWGGNVPPYLKEYFGYGKIIRGWSDKVFEGDNLLGLYAEFRFPVIKPAYIEGKDIPLINKISFLKGLSYKYGLYFTTFFDMGGVWDKEDKLVNTEFRKGYGVGLNAILPFDFVGRMDLVFSKKIPDEFSIDLEFGLSASF